MLGIEDFMLAAEAVLGIDTDRLILVTKIPLAESALAAPYASFSGHAFYKHPLQQAAVLASRIMRNHPLPDGNKRVALILMTLYLEQHGHQLTATPQDIDRTFRAVAAKQMTEDYFHIWLRSRTEPFSSNEPS
ncbi:MAG TPA: Fic family protein [Solirubrobacteraceae bacterium]|nr:Fic family protein [Solirubrobacteraceae bacterium]